MMGSPVETSHAEVPFHGPMHAFTRTRYPPVTGAFSNLLDADAVDVEGDAVIGWHLGELGHDECEMFGSNVGVDHVRIGVLGGATNAVSGEQNSAFEHEVISMFTADEAVQKGLE